MATNEYKRKRDFSKTPEPEGDNSNPLSNNAFVIHKHDARNLHYDLRLESNGILKSWSVPKGPSMNSNEKRLAVLVEDHPYEYKNFEGIIPEGNYGAGTVIIWDNGNFSTLQNKSVQKGVEVGHFSFVLNGKKLKGEFSLIKVRGSSNNWLLIKKPDEYASEEEITKLDASVISGKNNNDLVNEKDLTLPKPMLAATTDKPFDNKDYIFEIKWDGYRALAKKDGKSTLLYSRNLNSFNERFPQIIEDLNMIDQNFLIDGEIVALKEGKPSFGELQNPNTQIVYYVFDILELNGKSLLDEPLIKRRKYLKKLKLDKFKHIKISDFLEEKGVSLYEIAKENKLEGIMAKKRESRYLPNIRSKDWQKIKALLREDMIICGFTESRSGGPFLGALILGLPERNKLKYVGHVGTGFSDNRIKELKELLTPLIQKESPFEKNIKTNMPVTWVKPEIVAEIEYKELTKEGLMRQPVFLGIRPDIRGTDILNTKNHSAEITNPNKIYWPVEGYTKKDLINYYQDIADYILPHLKDRPISLHRYPEGINGQKFYHKNIGRLAPEWIETVIVPSSSEEIKETEYMLINDPESLTYAVNLGSIELNPWLSRIQNSDSPDFLVIDLDPHEIDFKYVIKTALALKDILDKLGIFSLPKTSGKKGMHIFIPIESKYTYEDTKLLGEIIAKLTHEKVKKFTSVERMSSKRSGKVYIDYLQNLKGQTIASVYSVRPVEGATVSIPLEWSEINEKLDPKKWNLKTAPKRIKQKGDLFKELLNKKNDIKEIIKKLN